MPERASYPQGVPCWVDVSTPDQDAAVAFYSTLFGWAYRQGAEGTGGYGLFSKDGKTVAGIMRRMDENQPVVWSTYISVDDIQAAADRARELGAQVVVEPMEVLDLGHMAFIADPTGAFVGLWQAGAVHGVELVAEPGAPGWHELATRDADAAESFYEALLGIDVGPYEGAAGGTDYRVFNIGGEMVAGIMPMGEQFPEGIPPHWMPYFVVEDADATAAAAKEAGGGNPVEPFDVPGIGRLAVLTDPFEAHFSIMQPEPREG